jgi:hypothetical protein
MGFLGRNSREEVTTITARHFSLRMEPKLWLHAELHFHTRHFDSLEKRNFIPDADRVTSENLHNEVTRGVMDGD